MKDDYFHSEEFRELLDEYEDAVNKGMPVFMDADELADIADYYQMQERYDEAKEAIDTALSLSPGAIAPLSFKIREALWNGNIDEAHQYFDSITETDQADYVYDKAEIMLAEEKVDEADAYLREELKKVPPEEYQDFVMDVAHIYTDYDYPEQAMQWMTRAQQEDTPEFKELMARTLFGLGKYKDSERLWGELIDSNPFSKNYWNALASTQYMNEDYSHAVESSEYAIAIDPDDPDGLLAKANGLYRLNNYEEALKYYQRYSERVPDDELPLLYQGTCLINLGRNEQAIGKLREALQLVDSLSEGDIEEDAPYISEIYQELAFAYSELKDYEQAMQMLDQADEYDNDPVQTLVVRGHIMLEAERIEEAERYFRQAVIRSDNPNQTLLRVIVSLYDNHFFDAAYSLFQKYFKIVGDEHNDGYAYMALCCYDMKRYEEFLHYLKEACRRNPAECKTALGHLFPEDIAPAHYYSYIQSQRKQ